MKFEDKTNYMGINEKLRSCLSQHKIEYISYYHEPFLKVKDMAEFLQFSPDNFVRTYLLKSETNHLLLVIPNTKKFDINSLKKSLGKKDIRFVNNNEFRKVFKECDRGTIPPFKEICNFPIYVDESLNGMYEIVFNTGSKWESMKIKYKDFLKVVKPISVIVH
jgi:Ala-tRNA(Pro) deacylase